MTYKAIIIDSVGNFKSIGELTIDMKIIVTERRNPLLIDETNGLLVECLDYTLGHDMMIESTQMLSWKERPPSLIEVKVKDLINKNNRKA